MVEVIDVGNSGNFDSETEAGKLITEAFEHLDKAAVTLSKVCIHAADCYYGLSIEYRKTLAKNLAKIIIMMDEI